MKKIFTNQLVTVLFKTAFVMAFIAMSSIANGQITFAAGQVNPFGLTSVSLPGPAFADIDNDGDYDAFIGNTGGGITYFENTGTSTSPAFGTAQSDPFGIITVTFDNAKPALVDIDNDGDFDLFIGRNSSPVDFYENTGTNTSPAFGPRQSNAFNLGPVSYDAAPCFVDIDNDNDLDAFVGQDNGAIIYFENTGSISAPAYAAGLTNHFGLASVSTNATTAVADLDGDGDFDFFTGEAYAIINYYENTGSNVSPAFAAAQVNPYGLGGYNVNTAPAFVDIDGDGDQDLFVGDEAGNIYYFENTTSATYVESESDYAEINVYPNPANELLTVSFNGINEDFELRIINQQGQTVYSKQLKFGTTQEQISLNDYAKGIYFLEVISSNIVSIEKIVVD